MRILEIITLGEVGGAQTVLADLVNGFVRKKPFIEIDVLSGHGDYLHNAIVDNPRVKKLQVPWLIRNISPMVDIRAIAELKKLCIERQYDIVHCHSSKASLLTRVAANLAGVKKMFMTVHGLPFYPGNNKVKNFVFSSIEKITLPLPCNYIFVSPRDMEAVKGLGLQPDRCKLICNGRPVPSKPEKEFRARFGIAPESPVISMIARLSNIKNPLAFIEIAKIVLDEFTGKQNKPHFILIGGGPLYNHCQAKIYDMGLCPWIHLAGNESNAGKYLWESDISVLTSHFEACPLAVIESLATGTPVVASDVGGTRFLLKHGETGFLYKPNNPVEAASYLINMLSDKPKSREMGRLATRDYEQYFTVDKMVNKYISAMDI